MNDSLIMFKPSRLVSEDLSVSLTYGEYMFSQPTCTRPLLGPFVVGISGCLYDWALVVCGGRCGHCASFDYRVVSEKPRAKG